MKMEKEYLLKKESMREFISLYRAITEANNCDTEITKIMQNATTRKNCLRHEKWNTFLQTWQSTEEKIANHLALSHSSCALFEADIDLLAIAEKRKTYPIGKKYSKLRIYYQATDNAIFPRNYMVHTWTYPEFGIMLAGSLSHNDRIFKFEIAKTKTGSRKVGECKFKANRTLTVENAANASKKNESITFCSQKEFSELINICLVLTSKINVYLEKEGLEVMTRTMDFS